MPNRPTVDDTTKILMIVLGAALANVAFAAWLWWRHGFIRQVMTLLVLTAVLLFNAALFKVRRSDAASGWGSPSASSPR